MAVYQTLHLSLVGESGNLRPQKKAVPASLLAWREAGLRVEDQALGTDSLLAFWKAEMIRLSVETRQTPGSYGESASRDSSNELICVRALVC